MEDTPLVLGTIQVDLDLSVLFVLGEARAVRSARYVQLVLSRRC